MAYSQLTPSTPPKTKKKPYKTPPLELASLVIRGNLQHEHYMSSKSATSPSWKPLQNWWAFGISKTKSPTVDGFGNPKAKHRLDGVANNL